MTALKDWLEIFDKAEVVSLNETETLRIKWDLQQAAALLQEQAALIARLSEQADRAVALANKFQALHQHSLSLARRALQGERRLLMRH